ncbi:hypothetical protein P4H46_13205 [Paenibacillus glucanolyticus]|uniref:hypothetical protein n=1 Tax=Paenibacillus glucanolyticus TaxID=59843 RepID=UPI0030C9AAE0
MNWMKWLLKVSLTAILVSTLTIVTTGIVVNAYLQSVLASFNIQLETESVGVGGIMKTMLGMGSGSKPDSSNGDISKAQDPAGQGAASDDQTAGADQSGGAEEDTKATTGSSGDSDEPPVDDQAPEDSLPVMGTTTTESDDSSLEDQEIVMSPTDIVDRKESLSTADKEEIFTMLMNKLPQSEMQKISEAMEDGLTAAELTEIEEGISKYLNPEEFDKLISMLKE